MVSRESLGDSRLCCDSWPFLDHRKQAVEGLWKALNLHSRGLSSLCQSRETFLAKGYLLPSPYAAFDDGNTTSQGHKHQLQLHSGTCAPQQEYLYIQSVSHIYRPGATVNRHLVSKTPDTNEMSNKGGRGVKNKDKESEWHIKDCSDFEASKQNLVYKLPECPMAGHMRLEPALALFAVMPGAAAHTDPP